MILFRKKPSIVRQACLTQGVSPRHRFVLILIKISDMILVTLEFSKNGRLCIRSAQNTSPCPNHYEVCFTLINCLAERTHTAQPSLFISMWERELSLKKRFEEPRCS